MQVELSGLNNTGLNGLAVKVALGRTVRAQLVQQVGKARSKPEEGGNEGVKKVRLLGHWSET